MRIGELSEKTGLSRDTIRFYEKQKLIVVATTRGATNNYKDYQHEIYEKIQLIKNLKEFGFTLNEIKEMIDSWEAGVFECSVEKPKIIRRISSIEEKITQLRVMKSNLLKSIKNCPDECDIVHTLSEKRPFPKSS